MNNSIKITPSKTKPYKYTAYICVLDSYGLELRIISQSDNLEKLRALCAKRIKEQGVYCFTYGICKTKYWDELKCKVVLTSHVI